MTKVTLNGQEFDADAVINLMDDDLREEIHHKGEATSEQEFLDLYAAAHKAKFGEAFVVN